MRKITAPIATDRYHAHYLNAIWLFGEREVDGAKY